MNPTNHFTSPPEKHGLYDPAYEHDSCGVGFVAHVKGERSRRIIADADRMLRRMTHRGACGCGPEPVVEQLFIAAAPRIDRSAFCRQLYLIRKQAYHAIQAMDPRLLNQYY